MWRSQLPGVSKRPLATSQGITAPSGQEGNLISQRLIRGPQLPATTGGAQLSVGRDDQLFSKPGSFSCWVLFSHVTH